MNTVGFPFHARVEVINSQLPRRRRFRETNKTKVAPTRVWCDVVRFFLIGPTLLRVWNDAYNILHERGWNRLMNVIGREWHPRR